MKDLNYLYSINFKDAGVCLTFLFLIFYSQLKAQCDGQATFTDARDSRVYNQITIGTQCWMAENLNIGTRINSGSGGQVQTDNGTIEKFCYSDAEANCNADGGLYEWDEMMDYNASDAGNPGTTQGICPAGWHVPTDAEWCVMENNVEAGTDATCNISGWRGTNTGDEMKDDNTWNGTNTSGFSALPNGERQASNGAFNDRGNVGRFWTATASSGSAGWYRMLSGAELRSLRSFGANNAHGYAVRCVRDAAAIPLPVKLLYFNAIWTDATYESATLSWETITETDNNHFEIERSTDGINFEFIKTIEGNGNSNQNISYSTLDENPHKNGISYYRLKQVDNNGDFNYSNIEALNVPDGLSMISLYPNPSVDKITVLFTSSENTETVISVKNVLGQEVKRFNHNINQGFNSVDINLSELGGGNYFFQISTSSGLYKVERKFVKMER